MAAWQVRFFKRHKDDDPTESCPTDAFLQNDCPATIRARLFAILASVAAGPPPQFRGGAMWQAMHGDMAGYFEARALGPQKRLYRVFCLLEQAPPGLPGPALVAICGMVKKNERAFSAADYQRVRYLGHEYRRREPRNVLV